MRFHNINIKKSRVQRRNRILLAIAVALLVLCLLWIQTLLHGDRLSHHRASSSIQRENKEEEEGWTSIQIFYGKPFEPPRKGSWFSQANQDQVVAALTQSAHNMYFIDLAANDATRRSNTRALEERLQWNGLCIEPNPEYWLDLARRRCTVVGAVVGEQRLQEVEFVLARKEYGGIVGFDNSVHIRRKRRSFFTVPLVEVLERNHVPAVIDYMSLDIEGAEWFVMQHFPFERYTIRILTIERPPLELRTLLQQKGYILLKMLTDFGETLWVHSNFQHQLQVKALDSFALPDQEVELKNLESMNYTEIRKSKE